MVGLRGSTHGVRSRTTTEHDASLLDAITHDMIRDGVKLLDRPEWCIELLDRSKEDSYVNVPIFICGGGPIGKAPLMLVALSHCILRARRLLRVVEGVITVIELEYPTRA